MEHTYVVCETKWGEHVPKTPCLTALNFEEGEASPPQHNLYKYPFPLKTGVG